MINFYSIISSDVMKKMRKRVKNDFLYKYKFVIAIQIIQKFLKLRNRILSRKSDVSNKK